jgi:hypothetical protein
MLLRTSACDWLGQSRVRACVLLHPLIILRGCRQLQHGGGLTGDKPRDQHHLATWEFERVVMDVRIVHIELPEPSNLVLHARRRRSRG